MKRWIAMLLLLSCLLTIFPTAILTTSAVSTERTKGGKLIALTFDDGPCQYTNALLDGLAERGAKATFFLVGQSAECYPETVRRIFNEGHQVAQHSYTHASFTGLGSGGILTELNRTDEVLTKCLGMQYSFIVRPPYGSFNDNVLSTLGRPAILWSVDTEDWKYRNSATVCSNIVNNAKDGDIILCHDIHATTIPGALAAIDKLQAEGYEFVTINELFRRRNVSLQDGEAYFSCKPNGTDLGAAEAPEVSITPFYGGAEVTLTAAAGAKIYYSTNGLDPVRNGKLYSGPFKLTEGATLRTFSFYNLNGDRSTELTKEISLEPEMEPEIKVVDGCFVFENQTSGTEIRYTTDGTAPTVESEIYTEPIPCYNGKLRFRVFGSGVASKAKLFYVSARGNVFLDVPNTEWFFDYMDQAVSAGLFNGMEKYVYEPQTSMTRAMFVTTLYRMLEGKNLTDEAAKLTFTDVEAGSWYETAVYWAAGNGIVNGYEDGTFRPDTKINREEMCVMMDRLFTLMGVKTSEAELKFNDNGDISDWAEKNVMHMVAAGIIYGNEKNCFEPQKSATRAEVATVLIRVQNFLKTADYETEEPEEEEPTEPDPTEEPEESTEPAESTEPEESTSPEETTEP